MLKKRLCETCSKHCSLAKSVWGERKRANVVHLPAMVQAHHGWDCITGPLKPGKCSYIYCPSLSVTAYDWLTKDSYSRLPHRKLGSYDIFSSTLNTSTVDREGNQNTESSDRVSLAPQSVTNKSATSPNIMPKFKYQERCREHRTCLEVDIGDAQCGTASGTFRTMGVEPRPIGDCSKCASKNTIHEHEYPGDHIGHTVGNSASTPRVTRPYHYTAPKDYI